MVILQGQIACIVLGLLREGQLSGRLLAQQAAQYAVDKFGAALVAHAARQLHRLVAGSGGRNTLHIEQLISAHAEDTQNLRRHLVERTRNALLQIPVQRTECLHRAIDQLRRQPSVQIAQTAASQILVQRNIRISAIVKHHAQHQSRCSTRCIGVISFSLLRLFARLLL